MDLLDMMLNMGEAPESPLKKMANSAIDEKSIINTVAKQYNLDEEQTKLLHVIRKVENGRQGREFGVLSPEAMRFEKDKDPSKSFTTQAEWAAGTIKKRYDGDLKKFADRWAPINAKNDPKGLNKNWVKNAKQYMEME